MIITRSPRMLKALEVIKKVSSVSSSVLITGESGTGKELVARSLHTLSARRDRPFVAINCGAIPPALMESELFGHERGAFTGAFERKIGRLEHADGGTVFLDEVSTLPIDMQVKLLRVLQEKSFERVGGNSSMKVDIRVVAAANESLEKAVKDLRFRADLYYRLKVVPVELPPLRERREDIGPLTWYFLERYRKCCRRDVRGISDEAVAILTGYDWPGNVRELENLMERLVALSVDGMEIKASDIPAEYVASKKTKEDVCFSEDFREACREFERRYITTMLRKTNWNRSEAANLMKVHRNTLLLKMKGLDITDGR